MINPFRKRNNQKGNALVYVLISIALLGALSASLMESSGDQVSSQRMTETVSAIQSQANFIAASIQECILVYPGGDDAIMANPALTFRPQLVQPYPLMPEDTYLSSPTTGSSLVWDIRCPGKPGNSNNHARIFGGNSGKTLTNLPKPFWNTWYYYNSSDGVFIMTATTATDAYLLPALQALDKKFDKCEADVINARSGTVTVSSDSAACGAGHLCFRVWLYSRPSAMFPQEAGCP